MMVQICRAATGPTACYAERELKRYLRKYSGAAFGEGAELTFRLEVDESLPAHCYGWRWEESALTLRGGSESALLCCVYQLLSQLGVCFSTEGDFLKKPFALGSLPESRDFSPYCRYRGVRQHINFPMDISAYPLGEAKEYIRRLARMGMNAITFHSYNGQWHPYHKGESGCPRATSSTASATPCPLTRSWPPRWTTAGPSASQRWRPSWRSRTSGSGSPCTGWAR